MTNEQVLKIFEAQKARYKGRDLYNATRTEVHAALQLEHPAPYSDHPVHLPKEKGVFTPSEKAEIRAHQYQQVTDDEVIAAERHKQLELMRGADDNGLTVHRDAHHYVQKMHGIALWKEADALLESAGIIGGAR